jgi:hypothetical protein
MIAVASCHLRAGDDPRDPAPLHELLERVHIGRHAGHEHAALLLALLGDRQRVDVAERPHPQVHQCVLRSGHESTARRSCGHEGEDDEQEGRGASPVDEPSVERRREALVEDLLDEDGGD